MENTSPRRQKPDDYYKGRIAAVKPDIKGKPWRSRFLELNPDWNNAEDLSYLERCVLLRTADVFVTEQLERIAFEFAPAKAPKPDKK